VKRAPTERFTIRWTWAFRVGARRLRKRRNEKAVKLLKTNDLAKRRGFAGNDSNDLRPGLRNRSFRHAKDSFRFRGFWASSRPEAQSRSTIPIPAPPAPDRRRFEKLDRKKLRNGAAKALESLARVNLCADPSYAPVCPADGDFRPRLCQSEAHLSADQSRALSTPVVWTNQAEPRSNLGDRFKGEGSSRRPRDLGRPPAARVADRDLEFAILPIRY
jgi:hypothetical protein